MQKSNRALLVVDYQNDFVCGSLGFAGAEKLDSGIAAKIDEYRERGDLLLFTLDTHDSDYPDTSEGRALPVPHCVKGTDGWQVYGETGERLRYADAVFEKPAFGSDEMFDYLRGSGITDLLIVGLVTNICVVSAAVLAKAAVPEANITVDARLCASFDEKLHRETLDVLKGLYINIEE